MPPLDNSSSSGAFTRADLAEQIHKEIGLPRSEADQIIQELFGSVMEALIEGQNVKISSFGTFCSRRKEQRQGRDMKTGAPVVIPPRRVVTFRPSPQLLDKANGDTK